MDWLTGQMVLAHEELRVSQDCVLAFANLDFCRLVWFAFLDLVQAFIETMSEETMTQPPREWLICNDSRLAIQKGSGAWDLNLRNGETVHVIEKSAYDSALKAKDEEIAELKTHLSLLRDGAKMTTLDEKDAEIERLVAMLDNEKFLTVELVKNHDEKITKQSAEIARLKEIALGHDIGQCDHGLQVMETKLEKQSALLDECASALEFYANKQSYEGGHNTDGGHAGIEIDNYGESARKVLTKLKEFKEGK